MSSCSLASSLCSLADILSLLYYSLNLLNLFFSLSLFIYLNSISILFPFVTSFLLISAWFWLVEDMSSWYYSFGIWQTEWMLWKGRKSSRGAPLVMSINTRYRIYCLSKILFLSLFSFPMPKTFIFFTSSLRSSSFYSYNKSQLRRSS